jgi:hypothetical protein
MTAGRQLWAGLRLLDRQLVTNDDRLAGCIDDLELTPSDDGDQLYVTAIVSGPGGLAYRLGALRLGRWLRRVHASVAAPPRDDPSRIPFNLVADIGAHVKLGCAHDEVGTASSERWVRDHVIAHIPGAGRAPE